MKTSIIALIALALLLMPSTAVTEAQTPEFCREGQLVWIAFFGEYCMETDQGFEDCIVCGPDIITVYP